MYLFNHYEPWTEKRWWQEGYLDAVNCRSMRYGGEEAYLGEHVEYIQGYRQGEDTNNRTVKCLNLMPSTPFTPEDTRTFVRGLLNDTPEGFWDEWGWSLLMGLALFLLFSGFILWVERSVN